MQKKACREYVAQHPDWEIVDEISEKGVSGYKVSTNARDAIVEIKKRAITHQFDILLVFKRNAPEAPSQAGRVPAHHGGGQGQEGG